MFRPAPLYSVSSLDLSKSKRSEGSSDRVPVLFFLLWAAGRTVAAAWASSSKGGDSTGAAVVDDVPEELNIQFPTSARATTPKAIAAISFVRFSEPICIEIYAPSFR